MARPTIRVLLIGDEETGRLRRTLQRAGYEVVACESPQKAWGLVFPAAPDVVILRLQHPADQDALLIKECIALSGGAPIVLAGSGSGGEGAMIVLGKAGDRRLICLSADIARIVKTLSKLPSGAGRD